MILFLIHLIRAFLPAALGTGVVVAVCWPQDGKSLVRYTCWIAFIGVCIGVVVHVTAMQGSSTLESQIWLQAASLVSAVLAVAAALISLSPRKFVRFRRAGCLLFVAAINALATYLFLGSVVDETLSVSSVLNTDLILNVAALGMGVLVIVGTTILIARMNIKAGTGVAVIFLVLVCAINAFGWVAEIMLAALRLEMIEMTTGRLSFVAKATGYSYVYVYAQLALAGTLTAIFFVKRSRVPQPPVSRSCSPEWRKAAARSIAEVRAFKAAAACVVVMVACMAYHDLYASRPPSLSEAIPVHADSNGEIKINIDDVKEGGLHRYSYVTSDGTRVRFFLINRYKNSVKIGVVYDACMICGDMGYIQNGSDVICIACNVRMNIPSIGKPGGCNPIPFDHEVRDDAIVIKAAELDKGANYFHERVEIEVQDPVTGAKLINLKAPYRYDYGGRTYFFESEQSLNTFRENPENYVKQKARRFRSQGWQSGTHGRPALNGEERGLSYARLDYSE